MVGTPESNRPCEEQAGDLCLVLADGKRLRLCDGCAAVLNGFALPPGTRLAGSSITGASRSAVAPSRPGS